MHRLQSTKYIVYWSTIGFSTWATAFHSLHQWYQLCHGAWCVRLLAGDVVLCFVNTDLITWNLVDIVHSLKRPSELQCANSSRRRPSSDKIATDLTHYMRTFFIVNCNCDTYICINVLCRYKVTTDTTVTMSTTTNCLRSVESPPSPTLHSYNFIQLSIPARRRRPGDKQRVLMHGHQGWNVWHNLCHIYMRYVYIYELFIAFVSFVVCSLL